MKFIKSFAFVLAMSTGFSARAQGFDWGSLLGNLNGGNLGGGANGGQLDGIGNIGDLLGGGGGQLGDIGSIGDLLNGGDSSALMDLAFDAAYMYASSDPQYAGILMILGINSGDDLQAFLMNDEQNMNDIVSHLALSYASENPQFANWFSQIGVTDIASANKYMKNGKYKKTVHQMALAQARSDDNYSEWLSQLGINDLSDLQGLLNGDGGDIFANLMPLVEQYVNANYPEYAQFLPIIQQLLGGMGNGQDPSINLPVIDEEEEVDDPSIDLPVIDEGEDEVVPPEVVGAFRGLPVSEVKEIQKARAPAKKKPAFNFLSLFRF